jgi:hypothetical protein
VVQSYHAFEPRPGELAQDAVHRSRGDISIQGGDAPYRVVDINGGVELAGTRDQCIDFVELAWWRAETAPTNLDHVHAADRAARLTFEARVADNEAWRPDPYLTAAIARRHTW